MSGVSRITALVVCLAVPSAAHAERSAPSASALLPGVKMNGGSVDTNTGYEAGGSSGSYNGHSVPTDWVAGGGGAGTALGMPKDMADFLYEISTKRSQTTEDAGPMTRWGEVYSWVIQNECTIENVYKWESWSLQIITHLTEENELLEKAFKKLDADALEAIKAILTQIADAIVEQIPGNPGFNTTDLADFLFGDGIPNANTIKGAITASGTYAEGEGPKIAKIAGKLIDVATNYNDGKYISAIAGIAELLGSMAAGEVLKKLNLGNALADLLRNLWTIQVSTTEAYSAKVGHNVNSQLMDWGLAFEQMAKDCGPKVKRPPVTTTPGKPAPKDPSPPDGSGDTPTGSGSETPTPPIVTPAPPGGTCPKDRIFVPRDHLEVTVNGETSKLLAGDHQNGGCLYNGPKQSLYNPDEIMGLLGRTPQNTVRKENDPNKGGDPADELAKKNIEIQIGLGGGIRISNTGLEDFSQSLRHKPGFGFNILVQKRNPVDLGRKGVYTGIGGRIDISQNGLDRLENDNVDGFLEITGRERNIAVSAVATVGKRFAETRWVLEGGLSLGAMHTSIDAKENGMTVFDGSGIVPVLGVSGFIGYLIVPNIRIGANLGATLPVGTIDGQTNTDVPSSIDMSSIIATQIGATIVF